MKIRVVYVSYSVRSYLNTCESAPWKMLFEHNMAFSVSAQRTSPYFASVTVWPKMDAQKQ